MYLGTHPNLLDQYLCQKLYLHGNAESDPKNYPKQAVLWGALKDQKCFQFAREFGIDHGIYLFYPSGSSCEIFVLASTPEHPEVINFYLNNQDFLHSFILNFKDQAKKLLQQAEKEKFSLPFNGYKIDHYKMHDLNLKNLSHVTPLVQLSNRQLLCANLLLKGMKCKEIARELNLSPRTVETHINAIKTKLHCRNKSELIIKLIESQ